MRLFKRMVLSAFLTMTPIISGITATNAATGQYENFSWVSPNGWEGAVFDVPTWFAKDMLYSGREVIRFHDGFYKKNSTGFWTYAFVLLVKQTEIPTTKALIEETKRYFTGLARGIGEKNIKDYPADKINVIATSGWTTLEQSKYRSQLYQLESFDPFITGKPINLNLKITTWLCSDSQRAIHYAISPHSMSDPIWILLNQEINALKCW